MPCHLISDMHEWINEIPYEIPHCPYLPSSETTAKGMGLAEDPVELDSSLTL